MSRSMARFYGQICFAPRQSTPGLVMHYSRSTAYLGTLPLVVVLHTSRQIEVIDIVKQFGETKHPPELANLEEEPHSSLRGAWVTALELKANSG